MILAATIIILVLLICIFFGVPVMASIGFTAVIGMVLFMKDNFWSRFALLAFNQGISTNQLIAPLFILMSEFLARGGLADDIYTILNKLMKKIKGGLAASTIVACTIFAALCGSSPATAAAIGRISVDSMCKRKYRKDFAVGTVAGGGTLGIMIPPSITLVTYGILTETSISRLLVAGLLPGIMLAVLMVLSIVIRVRMNPALVGDVTAEQMKNKSFDKGAYSVDTEALAAEAKDELAGKDFYKFLRSVLPAFILIFLVLGSMYTGIATTSESAAVGVMGAFLIVLFQRRLNLGVLKGCFRATARTTSMIIFLTISSFCLSFVLSYLGLPTAITKWIVNAGLSKWVVLIALYILWLVLGCLMDPGGMIMLTIPFLFEPLTALGFEPIWIGIVATLCAEVGMITPPVGLNLFVLRANTGIDMKYIIKGSLPYVVVLLIGLVILTLFPQIALFLPGRM